MESGSADFAARFHFNGVTCGCLTTGSAAGSGEFVVAAAACDVATCEADGPAGFFEDETGDSDAGGLEAPGLASLAVSAAGAEAELEADGGLAWLCSALAAFEAFALDWRPAAAAGAGSGLSLVGACLSLEPVSLDGGITNQGGTTGCSTSGLFACPGFTWVWVVLVGSDDSEDGS